MSQEALIAIVTQETSDIEDADEQLRKAIEIALRLLDFCIEGHQL
jgi:hypothetical protein